MRRLLVVLFLVGCQPQPVEQVVPVHASVQDVQQLVVKGRGPMTGYTRAQFGPAWADVDDNGCDTRNDILRRDLAQTTMRNRCVVLTGQLHDPYSGRLWSFAKAHASRIQIDHVVALADAW
jgi:hypothetical protein